ncbi:MAG: DUF3048 domain-containing protein [Anaerolineales bacterium]|nr:DUF3048 domain-containing protein [Anaerolineales bacterium]
MPKFLKLAALLFTIGVILAACTPQPTPASSVAATSSAPPTETTEPNDPPPSPASATDTAIPPSDSPVPPAAPTPVAYGPHNFPANVDPLTGQIVGDKTVLERRPLAIKIQIFPRGQRPVWGASKADIIYDFYQNSGMTRWHAIFLGQDAETVGPVRSARLVDIDLIRMYKSIFAFGGAETRTRNKLFSAEFAYRLVVEGGANKCPPMCRVDPNGYNYLVTNTTELSNYAAREGIDNERQNLEGMSFSELPADGAARGEQIFARYSASSYNRWDFNPATGRYLRYQDTVEAPSPEQEVYDVFIDRLTQTQIETDNVVFLVMPHQYAFGTHPGNSEVINMRFEGSGKAYAFREGRVYEVTWNRPDPASVLFLTFPDGRPYPFKPGQTWFQIIGQSSTVEQPGEGIWRFQFQIP